MRGKSHDAGAPAVAVVPAGECDFIVIHNEETGIGDRGSMRVASEIGEHALGSAERRLGIDDEGALPQRAHPLGESAGFSEFGQIAEEAEFAATEGRLQAIEKELADVRDSA